MSGQLADNQEPEGGWRQYMPVDVAERRAKARKIIALLELDTPLAGAALLEIGTGTGVIPNELARAVGPAGRVTSIDTMDTRIVSDGYDFRLTTGAKLPFADASFDVVVSNHVVEHVGDRHAQQLHLDEIRRVLRRDGVGYLATPTRWALLEPHFRVPLLSWPPRALRDRLLRLARRGQAYDVDPYGPREIRVALEHAGLAWQDRTLDALSTLADVERSNRVVRIVTRLPAWLTRALRPLIPTMIFIVRPRP
jgi:SAM-dependent methyltransferase